MMEEKPIYVLQVTLPKIQIIRQNFQILEDIPQTLNTNYFYFGGLSLFLFSMADTNHVIKRKTAQSGEKPKDDPLNR